MKKFLCVLFVTFVVFLWSIFSKTGITSGETVCEVNMSNIPDNTVFVELFVEEEVISDNYTKCNEIAVKQNSISPEADIVTTKFDNFISYTYHHKNSSSLSNLNNCESVYNGEIDNEVAYVVFWDGIEKKSIEKYNALMIAYVDEFGQILEKSDVVTSVVNKKWETSNWQTYVGAAVGGAAGGVAALYSGPMCSAFISGAVSSFVGQSLEKITSETNTSFTTITENSIYAGIDCAAISLIIPTPQSNYIKGFQLEFDNSMVNIANRTTKEMSLSTFGKGMLSSVYTDAGSALLESSIQNFATSYEDENVIEIIS